MRMCVSVCVSVCVCVCVCISVWGGVTRASCGRRPGVSRECGTKGTGICPSDLSHHHMSHFTWECSTGICPSDLAILVTASAS